MMEKSKQIGFIGLGNMGFPMASRLAEAGYSLSVYDLRSDVQATFLKGRIAKGVDTPAEAAKRCALIITMLPDGKAVSAVVRGSEGSAGMIEVMSPGTILIDMSSSSPMGTKKLGQLLASRKIQMIDAPVSGGVPKAKSGELTIIAGGKGEVVKRCRPVFEVLGSRIFHSGSLGSGHAVKALNNMCSAAGLIAATEVLLVGQKFGVNPRVMNDILNASTGRNNSTENKMAQYVFSRSFSSGFSLDLMVKDLTTVTDLAREMGIPALFSSACRELWVAAQSGLERGVDHTGVVRWFEELARIRLKDGQTLK
ncbi:MAG: NAD(P)-dependent oxidoreductase [Desulfobacterales bacterium]|jgi:3-hydroxyisobutyrate dehydrogenase